MYTVDIKPELNIYKNITMSKLFERDALKLYLDTA